MYSSTERLYYTEAYRRTFTAGVAAVVPGAAGRPAGVVLDRTAFYPTSGGQPHDTGTLAGLPVIDVMDEGDDVLHILGGPGAAAVAVGADVEGTIDWRRRFDHMQQHTAQHVLSAAFLRVLGAETVSVHLGDSSTLDLELSSLAPEDARRVEEAVNQVVFENRPVTARFVEASEADALGLRRPARRTGALRVVEVEEYDRSACGGTHVRGTAEIGPVLLRRSERTRGRTRVEFLAGWRALEDYRRKHALIAEWSARLTVGEREVGEALDRLASAAQERERALTDARRRLVGYEAGERLAAAASGGGVAAAGDLVIMKLEVPQREVDELRLLLREMTARGRCVVLAGIVETGRVFFARSSGDGPDLAAVLGRACRAAGGRGGGSAEFAQGAVPPGEAVTRALAVAEQEVRGA